MVRPFIQRSLVDSKGSIIWFENLKRIGFKNPTMWVCCCPSDTACALAWLPRLGDAAAAATLETKIVFEFLITRDECSVICCKRTSWCSMLHLQAKQSLPNLAYSFVYFLRNLVRLRYRESSNSTVFGTQKKPYWWKSVLLEEFLWYKLVNWGF